MKKQYRLRSVLIIILFELNKIQQSQAKKNNEKYPEDVTIYLRPWHQRKAYSQTLWPFQSSLTLELYIYFRNFLPPKLEKFKENTSLHKYHVLFQIMEFEFRF